MRRLGVAALVAGLMGTLGIASPLPASEPFTPGSVISRAQSLRFGGFTGGTDFALTFGIALSRAQGTQGNAQAQIIDLGIFGLILSAESECTGEPVLLDPDQIPRPLRTNSVHGPSSDEAEYYDGQVARGGKESVEADPSPRAASRAEVAHVNLDPLMTIDGLLSTSQATIDAQQESRNGVAAASVGVLELAGGLVRLEDLRWDIDTTSGTGAGESATFTVGRIVLADTPLGLETPAEMAEALNAVNAALAPLGLSLGIPVVDRRGDVVEITPLVIRVGGLDSSPLLAPVLSALQPVRDVIFDLAQSLECPVNRGTINGILTVADIMLAALSGAGGLTLELGGARTTHDTTFFDNPFGDIPPATLAAPSAAGGEPVSVEVPAAQGAEGVPTTTEPRVTAAGPTSTRCETTHPSGSPGCWEGMAALAGGISLLVALGLLGADAYRSRRRKESA